jgi:hypothetical protein
MEKTEIELNRENQRILYSQMQENDHVLTLLKNPVLEHYQNLLKELLDESAEIR